MRQPTACALSLVAFAVSFLAACGNGPPRVGPATLKVRQEMVPGSGLYVEGSYSYVRMERAGRKVLERRLASETLPLRATLSLEPGSYTMVSFQRPCDPGCGPLGTLDPPTDQCSLPIEAPAGGVIETMVRLSPGKGCTIAKDG